MSSRFSSGLKKKVYFPHVVNDIRKVLSSETVKGTVFDIQRFSVHDSPGIRTTVFLKACSLHCFWCQNPEGINLKPEVMFYPDRCIYCGNCLLTCPNGAHVVKGERILVESTP